MQSYRERHKSRLPNFRTILDYFMALLMVFFGVFVFRSEMFLGYDYFEGSWLNTQTKKIIVGIAFILFGVFRAYNGYTRRKYERDEDDV